jgi:tetrahydromethanopterin S-methyltransferase subunit G
MTLQVQFWELLTLLITIVGGMLGLFFTLGKITLASSQKHLDMRFAALEETAKEANEQIAHRLDDSSTLRERVAGLEHMASQMPNHDDIGKVYERVNELSEQVGHIAGEMGAMRRAVEMVQGFLLQQKGKS